MQISPELTTLLKKTTVHTDTIKRGSESLKASNAGNQTRDNKLKKACAGFEAIILKQMLTQMRKNVPESGLLDKSYAHDMYQSLQDEQLAEKMAKGGGIGLARAMYKQISGQIKSSTGK